MQTCIQKAGASWQAWDKRPQDAKQPPHTLQKAVDGILVQAPSRSYSQPCCNAGRNVHTECQCV